MSGQWAGSLVCGSGAALVLAGVFAAGGCSKPAVEGGTIHKPHKPATIQSATVRFAPEKLAGGDARAWLTADGDMGDNNYCAARLKLPLAAEPAWEYAYSAAEIGGQPSQDIVHFDGLLAGTGGASVIFVLDAQSGKELLKQEAFISTAHTQDGGEAFAGLLFSQRGCLTALDETGRYYAWGWPAEGLALQSASEPLDGRRSGFVALDEYIVGSDGYQLAAMPQAQLDRTDWAVQLGWPPRGVVALGDGTVLAWTAHGIVTCIGPDGVERWRSDEGERLYRVVLEPQGRRTYVALYGGELICRSLETGAETWRFDWRQLVPAAEQESRMRRVQTVLDGTQFRGATVARMPLEPQLISEGPNGVAVVLQSGDAVMLDTASGAIRWHTKLHALVDHCINFENGLLVHMAYYPITSNQALFASMPFVLDPPDWKEIVPITDPAPAADRRAPRSANGGRARVRIYGRFAVLDPQTGKLLAVHVEASPAGGSIVPARDKLVVALARTGRRSRDADEPSRVVGYAWLEAGED